MNSTFVVHFFLFWFSLAASIIQGVTGFGDAILLQVVWYTATVISPTIFNATALGDSPVRAVTLLMYCRMVFTAPVLAYMSLHDGIFSLQMTLAMAIPSTLTALGGIFIFRGATSEELKLVLGISGLVFAAIYVVTLATKYVLRRRRLQQLRGAAAEVTIIPEAAAVEADLNASRAGTPRAPHTPASTHADVKQPGSAASPTLVSIATGSPFRRTEAVPRAVTEASATAEVPPLTPSKLSPSNTLSYTRVRINRNLDENGKIKLTTKIGASMAATLSGVMGSLTGVGGPPQIIFILLFDVPQYIMRVNFAMQSVPSGVLRFIYACSTGLFTKGMIPLFVTSLISAYIGLVVGVKLGKLLGPKTYSIFVLILLLLSSLVMITESVAVLITFTVVVFAITIVSAVYEHRQTAAAAKAQVGMETQLDQMRSGNAALAAANASHTPADDTAPLSPSASAPSRSLAGSRSASDSALADTASVSTGVSSHTSSRVRRAVLRRPPSLWAGVKEEGSSAAAVVVRVPVAGDVAAAAAAAAAAAPVRTGGMAVEDVTRWVALQDEELDDGLGTAAVPRTTAH